jgi:alpha-tubulin suppressor-like RCC1 family protein
VTLTDLTAAGAHTCAQGSNGQAYCWGGNFSGQLGDGTTTDRLTPTAVSAPAGVTLSGLTAGQSYTCALGSNGQAYCWGDNLRGSLGDGTTTHRPTPTAVSAPAGVTLTGLTVGSRHTCAQGSNGPAYCWGGNFYGELGDGTTTRRLTPTIVAATR